LSFEQAPDDPASVIARALGQAPDLHHLLVEQREFTRDRVRGRTVDDDSLRVQDADQVIEGGPIDDGLP
jgi:hypothetical protein